MGLPVSWEAERPALSQALRALTPDELAHAESDPVSFLSQRGVASDITETLAQLTAVPLLVSEPVNSGPRPSGVDDRKWRQLAYFVAAVRTASVDGVMHWVDWCAGKGHLGLEIYRQFRQPVHCVEVNSSLVVRGNECVSITDESVAFVCANVLSDDLSTQLSAKAGVVALHACGHLNSRLFELAKQYRPRFLTVVPCCYQRIDGMHFSPISEAGQGTGLSFTRHQLRLPALDEVKTSPERRQFRRREMAFRQGVDLLLREATGNDAYTALGKIPPKIVRGSFQSFAQFAADKLALNLPSNVNWQIAETAGWQRHHLVSALSISRQLFRRAIEIWLFLDRVAYLEENGYHVKYGVFCPREITPRNLMLLATNGP